ncbi:MAG TPA: hypothetical protein VFE58_19395 [Tepidisphaeraceae bacterium]|jgi:hypothetical protein|nr:hypothetical protein [Tepidisphaeraceae bacterium]
MDVRFLYDLDTGLPHIEQHGVSSYEALQVLHRREADAPAKDGARMAEGQTDAGRYLRVIYRSNEIDHSILVITAYDLTGKPLQAFRKRRRRRR